ncbi:MAG: hypothetical protein ACTSYS_16915 [Promethearchaeota archaeon]
MLNNNDIKFHHVRPSSLNPRVLPGEEVIITTWSELQSIQVDGTIFSFDDKKFTTNDAKVEKFFKMIKIWLNTGKEAFKSITIGIDPGFKKTGVAIFINNTYIEAKTILTDETLLNKYIRTFIDSINEKDENFPPMMKIKIGNGNQIEINKIISFLREITDEFNFEIEIVDEFQTNSTSSIENSKFIKISPDERAAINIALRKGTPLSQYKKKLYKSNFSKKQVKNMQNESRKMSSSKSPSVTINHELAWKVLMGKISLKEALEIQKSTHHHHEQ